MWRKTRVLIQERLRVYIQHVPVYAGTTRTYFSTRARGAGTQRRRFEWTHGEKGGGGHRQFCSPRFAHVGLSRASERFTKETLGSNPFKARQ